MKNNMWWRLGCLMLATWAFASCLKEDAVLLEGSFVEWDAAAFNANSGGRTYPILQRVPRGGEAVNNADPWITSNSDTVHLRVNLVGPHRSTPTELTFKVLEGETLPANHFNALAGVHYETSGTVVIPPYSSFGQAEIIFIPAPDAATQRGFFVLEINGAADVRPMELVRKIGISFGVAASP